MVDIFLPTRDIHFKSYKLRLTPLNLRLKMYNVFRFTAKSSYYYYVIYFIYIDSEWILQNEITFNISMHLRLKTFISKYLFYFERIRNVHLLFFASIDCILLSFYQIPIKPYSTPKLDKMTKTFKSFMIKKSLIWFKSHLYVS